MFLVILNLSLTIHGTGTDSKRTRNGTDILRARTGCERNVNVMRMVMTGNLTIFRVIWGEKKQKNDIFYKKTHFYLHMCNFFCNFAPILLH